jgi:dihydroorotate dehydrogenase electron transfer subunit
MIPRAVPAAMASPVHHCQGVVATNNRVSTGLILLEIDIDRELDFLPGQFAMLNLTGPQKRTFGRPFSILSCTGNRVGFLYRIVGGGTADLATLVPGREMTLLGPLGTPFPAPTDEQPAVLLAGGVGLPPVLAWWHRYARPGDLAFFGGRDPGDLPADLLPESWALSVDEVGNTPSARPLWTGRVTELATKDLASQDRPTSMVLACGPLPLLAAAGRLAAEQRWDCFVSMEEHMGCGYGACKGCVIPVHSLDPVGENWRNATCCQEGPVFRSESILWDRIL